MPTFAVKDAHFTPADVICLCPVTFINEAPVAEACHCDVFILVFSCFVLVHAGMLKDSKCKNAAKYIKKKESYSISEPVVSVRETALA